MKLYSLKKELHLEGWKLEAISNGKWVASKVIRMKNGKGIVFVGERDSWFFVDENYKPIEDIEGLSEEDLERRKVYLFKNNLGTLYHQDYVDNETWDYIVDVSRNIRHLNYE